MAQRERLAPSYCCVLGILWSGCPDIFNGILPRSWLFKEHWNWQILWNLRSSNKRKSKSGLFLLFLSMPNVLFFFALYHMQAMCGRIWSPLRLCQQLHRLQEPRGISSFPFHRALLFICTTFHRWLDSIQKNLNLWPPVGTQWMGTLQRGSNIDLFTSLWIVFLHLFSLTNTCNMVNLPVAEIRCQT